MSFTDKKLEIAIAGFAVLMIGGMGYLLKAPMQAAVSELEVVYEMPRPKSFLASLFELGDREVSREYKNPFADKKKIAAKAAEATPEVKKEEAKKGNIKKRVVKKETAEDKKPQVDVQVVGSEPTGPSFSGEELKGGTTAGQYAADTAPGQNNNPVSAEAADTLSGDQWRALVLAQPTDENVAKLVAAYQAREIDDAAFYQIVTDLFRSNNGQTQALGLTAAKAVYSARSFIVVSQFKELFPTELKNSAESYLVSYTTTARLGHLKGVLQSTDSAVVMEAADIILDGYQAAKTGQTSTDLSDPRGVRGDVTSNSLSSYTQFVPYFQQLAQSSDSNVASLASSFLSQIQTTAVAAL